MMHRLSEVRSGNKVIFDHIDAGINARQRLTDMGLLPGEMIRVLHNTGHGPVTVAIKGVKIAIGHGLAYKTIVRGE